MICKKKIVFIIFLLFICSVYDVYAQEQTTNSSKNTVSWGNKSNKGDLLKRIKDSVKDSEPNRLALPRQTYDTVVLKDGTLLVDGVFHEVILNRLKSINVTNMLLQSSPGNITEIFSPATGRSLALSSMHSYRISHTQTVLSNGNVLVAGGYIPMDMYGSDGKKRKPSESIYSTIEIFDTSSRIWKRLPLPKPLIFMVVVPLDAGSALITGGTCLNISGNKEEVLDANKESWIYNDMDKKLIPVASSGFTILGGTGFRYGKDVIIIGMDRGGNPHTLIYNSKADSWKSAKSPPIEKSDRLISCRINDRGLLINSYTDSNSSEDIDEGFIYSPAKNSWKPFHLPKHNTSGLMKKVIPLKNGLIYVHSCKYIYRYNFSDNRWIPLSFGKYNIGDIVISPSKELVVLKTTGGVEYYDLNGNAIDRN